MAKKKPSLKTLKAKAKKEGWLQYVKTKSDEQALIDGCYFSQKAADRVFLYFSYLYIGKKQIILLDWQKELVTQLFGWLKPDGTRRFKRLNCWVAKKAGKSFLCSILCLYLLHADGENSAEVANLASSVRQAGIIFKLSKQIVSSSPKLKKYLETKDYYNKIIHHKSYSEYSILSKVEDASEGHNFSTVVIDELHVCKRGLYESLEQSGIARKQPLLITISTAGEYDPASIAWEQWEWCHKVLNGEVIDTTILPIVYAADPEKDDPFEESTWFKANPSLGITTQIEEFRTTAYKAKNQPTALNNFLRRRLNIWTTGESSAINMKEWNLCNGAVNPDEWEDLPVFCGMDISANQDMTAFVAMCETEDNNFEFYPLVWLPEENISNRPEAEKTLYEVWSREGLLRLTSGNVVDQKEVVQDILEFLEDKYVAAIASDPWNAMEIAKVLRDEEGFPFMFQRQGFLSMNEPTKEFERWIYQHKIAHGDNPLLRWCASNCKAKSDDSGNLKFMKNKPKDTKRVDPIHAAINAVAAWQNQKDFA